MPVNLFYRSINGKFGRRNKCKYCLFDERRNKAINSTEYINEDEDEAN